MKQVNKILVVLALTFISAPTFASQDMKLKQSLNDIKKELREIRAEIRDIRRYLEDHHDNKESENSKWGCYIKDISAGGISGTGYTKAEAIGAVLEKCTKLHGACFENNIKCSSE